MEITITESYLKSLEAPKCHFDVKTVKDVLNEADNPNRQLIEIISHENFDFGFNWLLQLHYCFSCGRAWFGSEVESFLRHMIQNHQFFSSGSEIHKLMKNLCWERCKESAKERIIKERCSEALASKDPQQSRILLDRYMQIWKVWNQLKMNQTDKFPHHRIISVEGEDEIGLVGWNVFPVFLHSFAAIGGKETAKYCSTTFKSFINQIRREKMVAFSEDCAFKALKEGKEACVAMAYALPEGTMRPPIRCVIIVNKNVNGWSYKGQIDPQQLEDFALSQGKLLECDLSSYSVLSSAYNSSVADDIIENFVGINSNAQVQRFFDFGRMFRNNSEEKHSPQIIFKLLRQGLIEDSSNLTNKIATAFTSLFINPYNKIDKNNYNGMLDDAVPKLRELVKDFRTDGRLVNGNSPLWKKMTEISEMYGIISSLVTYSTDVMAIGLFQLFHHLAPEKCRYFGKELFEQIEKNTTSHHEMSSTGYIDADDEIGNSSIKKRLGLIGPSTVEKYVNVDMTLVSFHTRVTILSYFIWLLVKNNTNGLFEEDIRRLRKLVPGELNKEKDFQATTTSSSSNENVVIIHLERVRSLIRDFSRILLDLLGKEDAATTYQNCGLVLDAQQLFASTDIFPNDMVVEQRHGAAFKRGFSISPSIFSSFNDPEDDDRGSQEEHHNENETNICGSFSSRRNLKTILRLPRFIVFLHADIKAFIFNDISGSIRLHRTLLSFFLDGGALLIDEKGNVRSNLQWLSTAVAGLKQTMRYFSVASNIFPEDSIRTSFVWCNIKTGEPIEKNGTATTTPSPSAALLTRDQMFNFSPNETLRVASWICDVGIDHNSNSYFSRLRSCSTTIKSIQHNIPLPSDNSEIRWVNNEYRGTINGHVYVGVKRLRSKSLISTAHKAAHGALLAIVVLLSKDLSNCIFYPRNETSIDDGIEFVAFKDWLDKNNQYIMSPSHEGWSRLFHAISRMSIVDNDVFSGDCISIEDCNQTVPLAVPSRNPGEILEVKDGYFNGLRENILINIGLKSVWKRDSTDKELVEIFKKVNRFLEFTSKNIVQVLQLLVFLTSGGSPRGTELDEVRLHSSQRNERGLIWSSNLESLVILFNHSKTSYMSEHPVNKMRVLFPKTDIIMRCYIALIRPLEILMVKKFAERVKNEQFQEILRKQHKLELDALVQRQRQQPAIFLKPPKEPKKLNLWKNIQNLKKSMIENGYLWVSIRYSNGRSLSQVAIPNQFQKWHCDEWIFNDMLVDSSMTPTLNAYSINDQLASIDRSRSSPFRNLSELMRVYSNPSCDKRNQEQFCDDSPSIFEPVRISLSRMRHLLSYFYSNFARSHYSIVKIQGKEHYLQMISDDPTKVRFPWVESNEDEFPIVNMVHESFGHSVSTGKNAYSLEYVMSPEIVGITAEKQKSMVISSIIVQSCVFRWTWEMQQELAKRIVEGKGNVSTTIGATIQRPLSPSPSSSSSTSSSRKRSREEVSEVPAQIIRSAQLNPLQSTISSLSTKTLSFSASIHSEVAVIQRNDDSTVVFNDSLLALSIGLDQFLSIDKSSLTVTHDRSPSFRPMQKESMNVVTRANLDALSMRSTQPLVQKNLSHSVINTIIALDAGQGKTSVIHCCPIAEFLTNPREPSVYIVIPSSAQLSEQSAKFDEKWLDWYKSLVNESVGEQNMRHHSVDQIQILPPSLKMLSSAAKVLSRRLRLSDDFDSFTLPNYGMGHYMTKSFEESASKKITDLINRGLVRIVTLTPERACSVQFQQFINELNMKRWLKAIYLDEAHSFLMDEFRPTLFHKFPQTFNAKSLPGIPYHFLSATLQVEMEDKLIGKFKALDNPLVVLRTPIDEFRIQHTNSRREIVVKRFSHKESIQFVMKRLLDFCLDESIFDEKKVLSGSRTIPPEEMFHGSSNLIFLPTKSAVISFGSFIKSWLLLTDHWSLRSFPGGPSEVLKDPNYNLLHFLLKDPKNKKEELLELCAKILLKYSSKKFEKDPLNRIVNVFYHNDHSYSNNDIPKTVIDSVNNTLPEKQPSHLFLFEEFKKQNKSSSSSYSSEILILYGILMLEKMGTPKMDEHACLFPPLFSSIEQSLSASCPPLFIVSTTALSQGLNYPSIRQVLAPFGSFSVRDFHQELARCGRKRTLHSRSITFLYQPFIQIMEKLAINNPYFNNHKYYCDYLELMNRVEGKETCSVVEALMEYWNRGASSKMSYNEDGFNYYPSRSPLPEYPLDGEIPARRHVPPHPPLLPLHDHIPVHDNSDYEAPQSHTAPSIHTASDSHLSRSIEGHGLPIPISEDFNHPTPISSPPLIESHLDLGIIGHPNIPSRLNNVATTAPPPPSFKKHQNVRKAHYIWDCGVCTYKSNTMDMCGKCSTFMSKANPKPSA